MVKNSFLTPNFICLHVMVKKSHSNYYKNNNRQLGKQPRYCLI